MLKFNQIFLHELLTMIGISRCESLDEIISEAQKAEEIFYQRNKQAYGSDYQELLHNDGSATSVLDNEYPLGGGKQCHQVK